VLPLKLIIQINNSSLEYMALTMYEKHKTDDLPTLKVAGKPHDT
jgi:hypothetical protein